IILLKKKNDYYLSDQISPGLHNVGVMLPYTGLHYMLFDKTVEPAFIMTSANPPGEPIVIDNREAVQRIGQEVDFFLFHNREIAQRCDDSVIRVHGQDRSIIRRSRGYAPSPVFLVNSQSHCTLGVGAEENVNSTIVYRDKAFVSQYIGDVENVETFQFLRETINQMIKLTHSNIQGIACDLHPQFITTKFAKELGEKLDCPVFQIQHHYAHMLSLMGEKGLTQAIGIICDGVGYGDDGRSWGGEILNCNLNGFSRLGHLEEQPMVGGDLAAKYPLRMVVGILRNEVDIQRWLISKSEYFPHGTNEIDVLLKQLQNPSRLPFTTSCGRILDAASALLGICFEMTYDGEPAMKLESAAEGGKDVLRLEPNLKGRIVDTTSIMLNVFENIGKYSVSDLAFSVESYLAKSLALLAVDNAKHLGFNLIGFSGGVAYNEHITKIISETLEENGLKLVVHNQVPSGDGGISLGQALAANNLLKS
ncbi:MAG: hydrogenase maturation protein HypF, partial [Thermoproteota archaeon]|nr:hydrogenase maturation protein HypF [Thermoproteota archaeon]